MPTKLLAHIETENKIQDMVHYTILSSFNDHIISHHIIQYHIIKFIFENTAQGNLNAH